MRSNIGGNTLALADWNGNAECAQAFINRVVNENVYTQVADCPTRVDALLAVYHVRYGSSFNPCSTVQGISDHCGVLMEAEWRKIAGNLKLKG